LSRGDRRRNEKLARLRAIVQRELAIVAVDLAAGEQAVVVADHDSVVLERRKFTGSAWVIDDVLDWAEPVARAAGFAGVVLACEPTGHRWKALLERSLARGVAMVCVHTMLVHRGREEEDYTRNRSDYGDATVIARRTAELKCYVPVLQAGAWARLRHLGVRRHALVVEATAARQALRDLLECAWPAVLETASKPQGSLTWRACLDVSCDPAKIRAMGWRRFQRAVQARLGRWGSRRVSQRIMRAVFAAAASPGGISAERAAVCERAMFALADWHRALTEVADVEARLEAVLDELGLAELVDTIPGLSRVGAAAILAETGDPTRYDSPRAWAKHAGVCPRANESGTYRGDTKASGRGRSLLRTAAWRAIWGMLPNNSVYAARYAYLTGRDRNRLTDAQARTALASALLRQLYVMVTHRVTWDPARAGQEVINQAA
jgi:transposase